MFGDEHGCSAAQATHKDQKLSPCKILEGQSLKEDTYW